MTKILGFKLGDGERAWVQLRVIGRERPDAVDDDDGNWLQGSVDVRSGRMVGSIACSLRTEDLADLRRGLAQMTGDGVAKVECKTLEGRLGILIERVAPGRHAVSGHIGPDPDGNRLEFRFGVAASLLPTVLRDLDRIQDEYPVLS